MNDIQEKWNQIKESIRTEYELTNISMRLGSHR